ncbi:MAG: hypothetical protein AVDCRST_MAG76-1232, partial [uncultured Acidimicrobiales bacterium]
WGLLAGAPRQTAGGDSSVARLGDVGLGVWMAPETEPVCCHH